MLQTGFCKGRCVIGCSGSIKNKSTFQSSVCNLSQNSACHFWAFRHTIAVRPSHVADTQPNFICGKTPDTTVSQSRHQLAYVVFCANVYGPLDVGVVVLQLCRWTFSHKETCSRLYSIEIEFCF